MPLTPPELTSAERRDLEVQRNVALAELAAVPRSTENMECGYCHNQLAGIYFQLGEYELARKSALYAFSGSEDHPESFDYAEKVSRARSGKIQYLPVLTKEGAEAFAKSCFQLGDYAAAKAACEQLRVFPTSEILGAIAMAELAARGSHSGLFATSAVAPAGSAALQTHVRDVPLDETAEEEAAGHSSRCCRIS